MKHFLTAMIGLTVMLGCASNPIVGHGSVQSGVYRGEVGLAGNGSTLTIEHGSVVSKLSIVGDGCTVMVEDGVELRKVEFWGNGSTLSMPEELNPTISMMGTNQVMRRKRGETPNLAPRQSVTRPG
jgi:hypothetical protein